MTVTNTVETITPIAARSASETCSWGTPPLKWAIAVAGITVLSPSNAETLVLFNLDIITESSGYERLDGWLDV